MWTGSTAEALFVAWALLGGSGMLLHAASKCQLPGWSGPVTADTVLFWMGIVGLIGMVAMGLLVAALRVVWF